MINAAAVCGACSDGFELDAVAQTCTEAVHTDCTTGSGILSTDGSTCVAADACPDNTVADLATATCVWGTYCTSTAGDVCTCDDSMTDTAGVCGCTTGGDEWFEGLETCATPNAPCATGEIYDSI